MASFYVSYAVNQNGFVQANLGNRDAFLQLAVLAGQQSGERLCAFPMDEDYEPALDSKVADIKQCTLDVI